MFNMLKNINNLISVFLLTFNANAGSDGELKLEKQLKKLRIVSKLKQGNFCF